MSLAFLVAHMPSTYVNVRSAFISCSLEKRGVPIDLGRTDEVNAYGACSVDAIVL